MALLSLPTNDSSLLRKAGERAGICHLRRSAVFYLLPILSRTDNTLLMQRSKVGAVIEITELCCHQPFGRGQRKTTLLFSYKKLWSCFCK